MGRPKNNPPPPEQETLTPENTGQPPFPEAVTMTEHKIPEAGMSIEEGLAKGGPKLPDPVSLMDLQIGDRVTHSSRGDGTVTNRNDISGWVKFDRTPNDEATLFDLRSSTGSLTLLAAPTKGQPEKVLPGGAAAVPEAAVPLSDSEIDRLHTEAMFAHAAQGVMLAARARDLKQEQTNGQAALNEVHKALKDAQEAVVAHAEKAPTRGQFQQKTIPMVGTMPGTNAGSTVVVSLRSEQYVKFRDDQLIPLKDCGHSLLDLSNALFEEFKPGKKAKDVGKMGVEIKGSGYLIRQHSPDKTRWFAQLMVDQGIWEEKYAAEYGQPITSYDTNTETKSDRTKGGPDCGKVVKVGKKTVVLAPESHGLVIVASKEEVEKYISWQKASEKPEGERGEPGADDA
jgi:hypothetical protein